MCVLVRDVFKWVFNSHCTQSPRFCSLFQTHLLTCKCHPVRFSVITIIGSCTSTPNPKLILRVATRAGKKEKLCWRKRNRLGVYWFVMFSNGCSILIAHNHQDSVPCSKRIFLLGKCHPVRFSVITIIGSCASTPNPKLILRVATRAGKKEKLC